MFYFSVLVLTFSFGVGDRGADVVEVTYRVTFPAHSYFPDYFRQNLLLLYPLLETFLRGLPFNAVSWWSI